jgi:hypothetical protein
MSVNINYYRHYYTFDSKAVGVVYRSILTRGQCPRVKDRAKRARAEGLRFEGICGRGDSYLSLAF